jgi:hypothetical protein
MSFLIAFAELTKPFSGMTDFYDTISVFSINWQSDNTGGAMDSALFIGEA